jgi:hypothetical protein
MKSSLVFSYAVVALLAARGAWAQETTAWPGAQPGVRISLRTRDTTLSEPFSKRNALVGVVVGREPSALLVQLTSHDTLRVPFGSIDRASVSRGDSRAGSALRMGLFEGALFVLLPPASGEKYWSSNHFAEIGLGAAVGGVIGLLFSPERWKRLKP